MATQDNRRLNPNKVARDFDTAERERARNMMETGSYLPARLGAIANKTFESQLNRDYDRSRADVNRFLNRSVPEGDTKVRNFMNESLDRSRSNAQQAWQVSGEVRREDVRDQGFGIAQSSMMNELRMQDKMRGVQANAQSQASQIFAQTGGMMGGVAGGAGTGLGYLLAAQNYSKTFNGE